MSDTRYREQAAKIIASIVGRYAALGEDEDLLTDAAVDGARVAIERYQPGEGDFEWWCARWVAKSVRRALGEHQDESPGVGPAQAVVSAPLSSGDFNSEVREYEQRPEFAAEKSAWDGRGQVLSEQLASEGLESLSSFSLAFIDLLIERDEVWDWLERWVQAEQDQVNRLLGDDEQQDYSSFDWCVTELPTASKSSWEIVIEVDDSDMGATLGFEAWLLKSAVWGD